MSDDARKRAESVYQRAADLPPEERARYLDEQCGEDSKLRREVETLLAHHDSAPESFLESPFKRSAPQSHPERIGPYEIKRVLGEGGMGTVYLAEKTVLAGLPATN